MIGIKLRYCGTHVLTCLAVLKKGKRIYCRYPSHKSKHAITNAKLDLIGTISAKEILSHEHVVHHSLSTESVDRIRRSSIEAIFPAQISQECEGTAVVSTESILEDSRSLGNRIFSSIYVL